MKMVKMSNDFLDKKMKWVKIYIIFGILLILVNFCFDLLNVDIGEFWQIMLSTWGIIFVVMGIVRFLLYQNDSVLKKYKIAESDERYELLRGKAGYLTFILSTITLAICSVIFISIDLLIPGFVVLDILFMQYIVFLVLVWYYSKKL